MVQFDFGTASVPPKLAKVAAIELWLKQPNQEI